MMDFSLKLVLTMGSRYQILCFLKPTEAGKACWLKLTLTIMKRYYQRTEKVLHNTKYI